MQESLTKSLLRFLLRPAVKYCLRHALHIQDLVEIAKTVLVEESCQELQMKGQPVNVSRLSASSGLQRRDVERIYKKSNIKSQPQGLLNKIIGQWQFDVRFCDPRGEPRILSANGEKSEFYALVRSVTKDLNPGTLLFELERRGLAVRDGDNLVLQNNFCLISSGRGAEFVEEGFSLLSDDLVDISLAVEENMKEGLIRNLHGRTTFDNIPKAREMEVRAWLLSEGSLFHKRVREFLSQFDRDISPPTGHQSEADASGAIDSSQTIRVAVGAYGWIEEIENQKE